MGQGVSLGRRNCGGGGLRGGARAMVTVGCRGVAGRASGGGVSICCNARNRGGDGEGTAPRRPLQGAAMGGDGTLMHKKATSAAAAAATDVMVWGRWRQ